MGRAFSLWKRIRGVLGWAFLGFAILVAVMGVDHYLLLGRLSNTDLKGFHHAIHTLASAKTESQRVAAIRQVCAEPEMRHYEVALVGDNAIMFRTRSFFSDAYIVAHRIGSGETWALGWLRGKDFSRVGTYSPPTNPGGS